MHIYRLHRSVRAAGDYTGALLAGGRWNPPGTAMLYAAGTLSLACLEILVHLDKAELPPDFVWSSAIIPNEPKLLEIENFPDLLAFRLAGREWVETASELAVMVRSVVIRKEFNVLLSPTHPDYRRMVWSDAKPFRFDPRLFAFE